MSGDRSSLHPHIHSWREQGQGYCPLLGCGYNFTRVYIIIITIIITIIVIICFMQDIYTYIPETNYVPREYSVAAILLLLFMMHISLVSVLNLLYFYISTFRSICAVIIFITIIISWLRYCYNNACVAYEINPRNEDFKSTR